MNVNFSAFPYPDSEFSMELKGNSIELNPITFTVFPRVMPVQDIEMGENLEKLFDGLEQIQNGLTKLGSAADSVAGSSQTVYKGQQEFYQGIPISQREQTKTQILLLQDMTQAWKALMR